MMLTFGAEPDRDNVFSLLSLFDRIHFAAGVTLLYSSFGTRPSNMYDTLVSFMSRDLTDTCGLIVDVMRDGQG